jgi:3-deoxy-D-manno-octulosonate 8-phosphate phosphatase (KDO 8-P phosphatase)
MSSINYDLTKIKAFIFDVDGVLSSQCIPLSPDGEPMRTVNIKDGYALNLAGRSGYGLAIITGGNSEAVRLRFERLGIKDIYMRASMKIRDYNDYIEKTGYLPEEVVYIGDDIPDYQVMELVGLPVAPADAAPEIKPGDEGTREMDDRRGLRMVKPIVCPIKLRQKKNGRLTNDQSSVTYFKARPPVISPTSLLGSISDISSTCQSCRAHSEYRH